jgi:hypothetical protein
MRCLASLVNRPLFSFFVFIKDLKDPFFRQVYGERSMYLSR